MANNEMLDRINAISESSLNARANVKNAFVGLGGKLDAMEENGIKVASSNEVMQHFIENRNAICEQLNYSKGGE